MRNYYYILFLVLISTVSVAQKVKYKDLFPMLEVKNYEEAAPLLRLYLEQKSEDPSALYQAGLLHEYKTYKDDIVLHNIRMVNHADSSMMYFKNAKNLITEKEIKKRDKYYQDFNRRDLRTGDFGIKISDIQLDIDKRVKAINTYKQKSLLIKEEIEIATKAYNTARSTYIYLSRLSDRMNGLYLKSTSVTEESLNYLIDSYDSTMHSLTLAQKNIRDIRNKKYVQNLTSKEITVPDKEGYEEIDLHQSDIVLWNYKNWSENTLEVINTRIKPLRSTVKKYKQKLESLNKDPNTSIEDVKGFGLPTFSNELLELDEQSLALSYLHLNWRKLKFKVESDSLKNKFLTDTTNFDNIVVSHSNVVLTLNEIDSILSKTPRGVDLKQESLKYTEFLDEMKDVEILEGTLVDDTEKYKELKDVWNSRMEYWTDRARFSTSDLDSIPIPMFVNADSVAATNDLGYTSLNLIQDDSSRWYVNGLVNLEEEEVTQGFVARVRPNREVDWKSYVPIAFIDSLDFFVSSITMVFGNKPVVLFYAKIPGQAVYRCQLSYLDEAGLLVWDYVFETYQKPSKVELEEDLTISVTSGTPRTRLEKIRLDSEGKLLN